MAQAEEDTKAPDPIDLQVGKNIRRLRKAERMSQTVLAQKIGTTFQQVQKYERGANRVSASRLYRLSVALQLPISRFYDGVDGLVAETDVESVNLDLLEGANAAFEEAALALEQTAKGLRRKKT